MMKAMNRTALGTAMAVAVLLGPRVAATQSTVVGVVRDSAGLPIAMAEVALQGRRVTTDSLGRFFITHTPADSLPLTVRRLGYESVSFTVMPRDVANNSLDIVLRRLATALEQVNVTGMTERAKTSLRGFDERKANGLGTFVTREDIVKRNTSYLTDVLRQQRGVVIMRTRAGGRVLRFAAHQTKRCQPLIWLDGQAAPGLEIDQIHPEDVEGIELYSSIATTPGEFHRFNTGQDCGTVVIWTRRPRLEVRPKQPG